MGGREKEKEGGGECKEMKKGQALSREQMTEQVRAFV